MSKTKISEYSATANSNTDVGGINIDEGCAPSGINDAIRTLMAQLKNFQTGTGGDSFNGPIGSTTAASGAFTTLSATGVATFSAGSASAPALTTSGDTNTGIAFPAADTVAVATGGTERVRVDSSGNVGVGVTPSAWGGSFKALQVGSVGSTYVSSAGDVLFGRNTYNNGTNSLYLTSNYASAYGMISGQHQWYTAASGTAGNAITFTQAMTLDSSGRLLLGSTTAPSSTSIRQLITGINSAQDGYLQIAYGGGGGGYVGSATGAGINFGTYTGAVGSETYTDRMKLDASGNLGIGNTNPSQRLDLQNGSSDVSIRFRSPTNSGYISYGTDNSLQFLTSSNERARIDSSGNLLVGTTSKLSGGLTGFDVNGSGANGLTFGQSGVSKGFLFTNSATSQFRGETASGYTITFSSGGSNGVSLSNGGTSWGSLSDERRKDIIEPITEAVTKISSLRTVIGKYKTDDEGTRRSFLIAQDVQAVLPEAVVEENGDLILQYTDTIPLLVAAIKEQQAIITSLTARLDAANL